MELVEFIQPGMSKEETFCVQDEHSATHVGSGAVRVLATPWMIAFMERVSHRLLMEKLPQGRTSVGAMINVRHLAPTPLGSTIRVRSEITAVEGSKVMFRIQAWDESEQVGEGEHLRVVVDEARFLKRVTDKINLVQSLRESGGA